MDKRTFVDQLGTSLEFHLPVKRIISVVPSQTELLYHLGLKDEVVGITKFCVHPIHWLKEKSNVGGTKNFHFESIDSLRPDLIIGNKEENYQEGIDQLKRKYPVWMSDIITLDDAFSMITSISVITGKQNKGLELVSELKERFESVATIKARALYLMWKNPWMGAGKFTFINSMMEGIGLTNVLQSTRYPELQAEEIQKLNPEVVLLSSEPFPFNERHRAELKQHLPKAKIILVDGEMFSWYGSRLLYAPGYFKSLTF